MNYPLIINHDLINLVNATFDDYTSKFIKALKQIIELILTPVVNVILFPLLVISMRLLLELIVKELQTYICQNTIDNITTIEEYKKSKNVLDKLNLLERDIKKIQTQVGKYQLTWLLKFMFKPLYKIQNELNSSKSSMVLAMKALNTHDSESKYFSVVSEHELWDNRAKVYDYIL